MSFPYNLFSKLLQLITITIAFIAFLLSPLRVLFYIIYSSIIYLVTLPYNVMLKLENIYIYVGCAAIIGLLLGSCFALFFHLLKDFFGLYPYINQENGHLAGDLYELERHGKRQIRGRAKRRPMTASKKYTGNESWAPNFKAPQRPSRIDLNHSDEHITQWLR